MRGDRKLCLRGLHRHVFQFFDVGCGRRLSSQSRRVLRRRRIRLYPNDPPAKVVRRRERGRKSRARFAYSAIRTIGFAEERTEALTLASYAFCVHDLPSERRRSRVRDGAAAVSVPRLHPPRLRVAVGGRGEHRQLRFPRLFVPHLPRSARQSHFLCELGIRVFVCRGVLPAGTEADAEGVSYPSAVANALYYYSEEDPISDGNYWHYDESGNIAVWEMV